MTGKGKVGKKEVDDIPIVTEPPQSWSGRRVGVWLRRFCACVVCNGEGGEHAVLKRGAVGEIARVAVTSFSALVSVGKMSLALVIMDHSVCPPPCKVWPSEPAAGRTPRSSVSTLEFSALRQAVPDPSVFPRNQGNRHQRRTRLPSPAIA